MKTTALALILACGALVVGCAPSNADPPNVLFVLADDLRWDALGRYGNSQISTPHLDRLADEGVALDSFHVASPVCVASRISFHSGRHLIERQVTLARGTTLEAGTLTVAQLFRSAGYATAFIGKAHATHDPVELGFEAAPFYTAAPRGGVRRRGVMWARTREQGSPAFVELEGDPTERTIDEAIAWLRRHGARPWFLWLATTAPHHPYYEHEEFTYEDATLRRPPGFPVEQPLVDRGRWRRYYSQISHLDQQLGRLLASLEATGQRDRTLVIFTSDNGIMHGSHGIQTKGVWFEEAVRQPWIARWPGAIEAGTRSRGLASSVDFLPTVAELLGIELADEYEGRSLLPMLRGGPSSREFVYASGRRHDRDGGGDWRMVRSTRAKYVELGRSSFFYDLAQDPFESRDASSEPPSSSPRAQLEARLSHWTQRFAPPPPSGS